MAFIKTVDLCGQKFGRLTVLKYAGRTSRRSSLYKCVCDCGTERIVRMDALKSGKTVSCGCYNKELAVKHCLEMAASRTPFRVDLTGKQFNRLTVIKHVGEERSSWLCLCGCGNEIVVRTNDLTTGKIPSCGCSLREGRSARLAVRNTTHGLSTSPEYSVWAGMMKRCFRVTDPAYPMYGGRGIVACEFIRATPENLILLVGWRPSLKHELDRIDNRLGYWCGQCAECLQKQWKLNVRWVTRTQNLRNRSNNTFYNVDGVIKCASEWAETLGLTRNQFIYKYRNNRVQGYVPVALS